MSSARRLFCSGEAEIRDYFGGKSCAISFFLEQFRIDGGGLATAGITVVLEVPAARGVEVDEGGGDLFYFAAALGADVVDGCRRRPCSS